MSNGTFRNGVPRTEALEPRRRASAFSLRLGGDRIPGKIEAAVAAAVICAVFGVAWLIVEMPGPLVVQVRDDADNPVVSALVACESPSGEQTFHGVTDVFGEAKWPGLKKGPWRCEVNPPLRYHAQAQRGSAVVEARRPATWRAQFERPARVIVRVKRPSGQPRAAVAVRAVCEGDPVESWEARAGVLDENAILWLPHGRTCRAGLVRAELPLREPGPVTKSVLDCEHEPCTGPLLGGVGADLADELDPTAAQWEAVRPEPEPE